MIPAAILILILAAFRFIGIFWGATLIGKVRKPMTETDFMGLFVARGLEIALFIVVAIHLIKH